MTALELGTLLGLEDVIGATPSLFHRMEHRSVYTTFSKFSYYIDS